MKILEIFLIYLLIQSSQGSSSSNIVFVYEHVRHGARSPLFAGGSINYVDHFGTKWEGASILTAIGKRTHYILGIQNRIKYNSLINFAKLDTNEVAIFSTNSARTLQSIQAELQAMYLPGTLEPLTEEELAVALPPIKEIPSKVFEEVKQLNHSTIINGINVFPIQFSPPKKLRLNEPEYCPYMSYYQKQLENEMQNEINSFLKDFDEKFGEKLQKYFKMSNRDFIYDFNFMELIISDEFICNYFQGSKFSEFNTQTNISIDEFFTYMTQLKDYYIFHINIDKKSGVMASSPQMRDLVKYMENIIQNKTRTPKMVIQGGHDTTINYIQYFMYSVFHIPIKYIPFASNLYFELHKNDSTESGYYIEYISDGVSLMKKDFDDFKAKVLKAVWSEEEIDNFCNNKQEETHEINSENEKYLISNMILLIVCCVSFVLISIFLTLFIYYCKKSKNHDSLYIHETILSESEKDN